MRTIVALALAVTLSAPGSAQERVRVLTPQDRLTEISLGDGAQARIGYDNNVKFLYLPGRAVPVHFPVGVVVSHAVVSPNRQLLLLHLMQRRPDAGSDYFACLLCRRSDTTPNAKWTVNYVLLGAALDLKFDLQTWVDDLHAVSDDGLATLKLAQDDKRVPPSSVLRSWELWDLNTQERVKRIKDAQPFDKF